jgi:hypothetical protein
MADKLDRLTDEIAETLREVYETTESAMLQQANKLLVKGEFNKQKIASITKLRKELLIQAKEANEILEAVTKNAGKLADFSPKKVIEDNRKGTELLIESTQQHFIKSIQRITRLEKTMPLYEAIFKQTQEGIKNGLPIAVKGKDGKTRQYGYKEYMEMSVRTTVQREIGETQLSLGTKANTVFYLCNSFADCADDHADFQGQLYYHENYKSFNLNPEILKRIDTLIQSKRMRSFQDVRENEPYLTTRPNCRHRLTPISIDQALNESTADLMKALRLSTGTYKAENYDALQEQRYNERMIREYKDRLNQNESMLQSVDKGSEIQGLYQKQVAKDKSMVKAWQARQRTLIKSNANLERDYRKETRNILVQDLGARYNINA